MKLAEIYEVTNKPKEALELVTQGAHSIYLTEFLTRVKACWTCSHRYPRRTRCNKIDRWHSRTRLCARCQFLRRKEDQPVDQESKNRGRTDAHVRAVKRARRQEMRRDRAGVQETRRAGTRHGRWRRGGYRGVASRGWNAG